MNQVKLISGRGIPLTGDDIDTDRIIPARFLRCVTFDGLGEQVFADDRSQLKGEHPFDQPQYQGANILVVNANFGCGSSREHAPQAIIRWGIKAIIGESFAEIFFGNCIANGVPCVTASPEAVKSLQSQLQNNPQAQISLDLTTKQVKGDDWIADISMGEGSRQMLLEGTWDSCGQLTQNPNQIKETAQKLLYLVW
ncbi:MULTISPECIES: 3-isopropylmalate dehydratase small subunit [Crocosphaera]|uniref:3-isopropylmalate dehydratase small subunit n=3 Tax=Crocosphaera watsonii TaxID=263511 RepID=T2JUB1_CROWT|nr:MULTISPECIES: 3-isopropylmalate dehydratase small subunit [Crocosphaera]EHJ15313.1 3-isopropylmalate dehydratase small subunit [Crocosphaera watsonii WH 0003]NQZ64997.1 3-isopropylmalate dehydratase small subunit [Crocosphaera sp.]CCQ59358.1 3-isopropylmalate dehydratase small subunit [Crocosphaera watsonii WH 0005]CCQ68674.1 3-isopropylmalate dehydratase small subunit [Crocosphaera watsonii WH 0402]